MIPCPGRWDRHRVVRLFVDRGKRGRVLGPPFQVDRPLVAEYVEFQTVV